MSYAIDTCIVDFLASNGPADFRELLAECRMQCTVTVTQTAAAQEIARLMLIGSIGWYDNDPTTQAYDLASGEL